MKTNRLIKEKNPYLLQHAYNPVDWYPWSDEAFNKARREDKPVFLSIGYSTCHWCHVMERESFDDHDVASLLNDAFINIKVDREERPDIDAVYMKACHLMTQSGGWPLTIIMTPDKQPFFAATYIPKESRHGRSGMMDVIPRIKTLWRERRSDIFSAAGDIVKTLQAPSPRASGDLSEETLHRAYRSFSMTFDKTSGGFGPAPKFPSPHNFFFLLRYWKRFGDPSALRMVEYTLNHMRRGGIFDHIGFGFHRYSTDAGWIVPHFEKMLYDQAMLAMAYTELFQATGNKTHEDTAREIFTYVLRDMTDRRGGFYSAEDADSEGSEGKFYLWHEEEIRRILATSDADLFLSLYRHPDDANLPGMQEFPDGLFIPHLKSANPPHENRRKMLSGTQRIRDTLFAVREKRIRPHKDDKILTDWNGLMIAALARGAQAFDEPMYARAAVKAMDFILHNLQTGDGRLLHRYRGSEAAIEANADDYAFIVWALLDLYEATFQATYLKKAFDFQSILFRKFYDRENGGFFFTSSDAEKLLTRPKELFDGAVPSGNSVAFLNALRLSRITGDNADSKKADEIYRAFCAPANAMPSAFAQFLCGYDFALGPSSEIIIAGDLEKLDTQEFLKTLRENFLPNKIVILRCESRPVQDIDAIAPAARNHSAINQKATVYVCTGSSCSSPTNDPQKMMELLHL